MSAGLLQRLRGFRVSRRAFTVVELLVAIGILSAIVLILFRVFDQTQRAMRGNVSQTDVMEGARAAMEMIVRELEQAQPLGGSTIRTNVVVGLVEAAPGDLRPPGRDVIHAIDLPGENSAKVHFMDSLYFVAPNTLTPSAQLWTATFYRVLSKENVTPANLVTPTYQNRLALGGVGSLTKWTTNFYNSGAERRNPYREGGGVDALTLASYQKLIEGVVHFRITPLDSFGRPLYQRPANSYFTNVVEWRHSTHRDEWVYAFTNSALPAFFDVELGILEPQAVDKWRALPERARARFLADQSARVHYFQQRVPVRNAPKLFPLNAQP